MTDENADRDSDSENGSDRETDENAASDGEASVGGALRNLLDAVSELRSEGTLNVDRATGGRGRTDYGFSVSTLDAATGRRSETQDYSTGPTDETLEVAEETYATAVHPTDEGAVVTADLPDVDPEGLSAGIADSSRTLLIADDERLLTRVSLERGDLAIDDATYNNGVLELRLRPTDSTTR